MIEIDGNQRARDLVNMVDGVQNIPTELQQLLSSYQRHMRPRIVLMKHDPSDSLFLDVFIQLLSSIRLIGNNTSLNLSSRCLVKAHNTGSLSNPTRHRA